MIIDISPGITRKAVCLVISLCPVPVFYKYSNYKEYPVMQIKVKLVFLLGIVCNLKKFWLFLNENQIICTVKVLVLVMTENKSTHKNG